MDVTNIDTGQIEVRNGEFFDAKLWFASAGTIAAGTILARPTEVDVVDAGVTVTPDGGNAGNGTVTAIVVSTEAVVGSYSLTCTAEEAHGGTFELRDPDGGLIADDLVMDAGDGATTVFTVGGLQISVTDGVNDFDTDDTLALVVAATADERTDLLVPFDPDGSDDAEVPKYVLTYDVASSTEQVVTVAADIGNTGDGEVSATVAGDVKLGAYTLVCSAEVADGGVFTLTDPDGEELSDSVTMTPEAEETVVHVGGLRLVIGLGDTDFDTDDEFTITIREQFAVKGIRILAYGQINRDRLLIHKDGDGDNITGAHLDTLRGYGIVASPVQQLSQLDNQ